MELACERSGRSRATPSIVCRCRALPRSDQQEKEGAGTGERAGARTGAAPEVELDDDGPLVLVLSPGEHLEHIDRTSRGLWIRRVSLLKVVEALDAEVPAVEEAGQGRRAALEAVQATRWDERVRNRVVVGSACSGAEVVAQHEDEIGEPDAEHRHGTQARRSAWATARPQEPVNLVLQKDKRREDGRSPVPLDKIVLSVVQNGEERRGRQGGHLRDIEEPGEPCWENGRRIRLATEVLGGGTAGARGGHQDRRCRPHQPGGP